MRKIFGIILISLMAFPLAGFTQASPESYKNQADGDVQVAFRFQHQAMQILQGGRVNRDKLETAIHLLVQAGQLFERAANTYTAVGINYASSQDANNAYKAMQNCLDMIQEIKKRLQASV